MSFKVVLPQEGVKASFGGINILPPWQVVREARSDFRKGVTDQWSEEIKRKMFKGVQTYGVDDVEPSTGAVRRGLSLCLPRT